MITSDIAPYRERKVRVLNGGHTVLVPVALLAGLETVREACENERVGRFLRRVMFDEIVPSLSVPCGEEFARETLDRFANPYIRHALIDITLHATSKPAEESWRYRCCSTTRASVAFRRRSRSDLRPTSPCCAESYKRSDALGLSVPDDSEGDRISAEWHGVDLSSDSGHRGLGAGRVRRLVPMGSGPVGRRRIRRCRFPNISCALSETV